MTKEVEDLINWSALSQHLSENNSKNYLRRGKIPKEHREKIEQLGKYINHWIKGTKLMTKQEVLTLLKNDLNEIQRKITDLDKNLY